MNPGYRAYLEKTLADIEGGGLFKRERVLTSPQRARVAIAPGREVLNFCANNYLGLADHPEIIRAAHVALDRWGYGLSSVRFICGTQEIHRELEAKLSAFLGTDETILYSSCFDANGGVFETLLGPESVPVVVDAARVACREAVLRIARGERAAAEDRINVGPHRAARVGCSAA